MRLFDCHSNRSTVAVRAPVRIRDWYDVHRVDLRSELQEIYLHRFLFTLAINTVAIFLPLYVYEQAGAAAPVFLFFAVYYGMFIVLVWPVAKLTARIGYKHASLLSSPFILGFYLLLRTSTSLRTTFLAAAVGGVGFITYWIGMNAEMARNSHDGRRGAEAGVFFSMPKIAAILSPLFGGLLLSQFGFPTLFAAAAGLVTLSYAPFLLSVEHFDGMEASPRDLFTRAYLTDFLAYVFRGAAGLYGKVVWPLYIAVVIGGALNIGGAGTVMSVGGVIASLGLGRLVTPATRGRVMLLGGGVTAGTFLVSSLVTTPVTAFAVSFVNGVSFLAVTVPLYSTVMARADHTDIIEYFAFREVGLCTGRVLYLAATYLLFTTYGIHAAFLGGFAVLAVAGVLGAMFGSRIRP